MDELAGVDRGPLNKTPPRVSDSQHRTDKVAKNAISDNEPSSRKRVRRRKRKPVLLSPSKTSTKLLVRALLIRDYQTITKALPDQVLLQRALVYAYLRCNNEDPGAVISKAGVESFAEEIKKTSAEGKLDQYVVEQAKRAGVEIDDVDAILLPSNICKPTEEDMSVYKGPSSSRDISPRAPQSSSQPTSIRGAARDQEVIERAYSCLGVGQDER